MMRRRQSYQNPVVYVVLREREYRVVARVQRLTQVFLDGASGTSVTADPIVRGRNGFLC